MRSYYRIAFGESEMLRRCLLILTLSFTLSAAALFGRDLQTISADTVILTVLLSPGEPPLQVTLRQMMDIYKEPGFSAAIIEHSRVVWAKGFGVTTPGGNTPVTPATLFQAASISKPVTAAGGLWLVQHGKVSLDEDVNLKLKSWKVPENDFTATQKVTLRRLMSHNAGFNVHGFAGYAQDSPLPTTEQTLDGLPPANNPPIRVTVIPGTQCIYSGGGVTVEGLLIRDVSGQSFEEFMRRNVLLPAGMTNSTFQQHLPRALAARAATGTRGDGQPVPGRWHLYPELSPDGLWSTPSDLARFAIEIALSAHGVANRVLSQPVAREMLTVQCHDVPSSAGGIALGFGIGYQNHPALFRHSGGNDGFGSFLTMDADGGWGYAAMGNSDNFESIDNHVVETIAKLNGWDYPSRPQSFGEELFIIHAIRGMQAALDHYQRAKSAGFVGQNHDYKTLNLFGYSLLREKQFRDAIRVFKLNVAEYPGDADTYDSLAEAYMDAGERENAIQNYEESLRLNPQNQNAISQLKKLRAK
jgi:CubicO group peptidase (beta-lactamase class C family)